ncbi:lysosome membrane protein 2-like isoform X2 [Varroa destructor]|uniref:Scavenger receptor class B member 1 n=1 Tax=Varroa destructor TaxID=109461 RepID=A0A7M7JNG2_VARDE|nr:lysosome membrane protein 2-like isoform X2 [Varroa destructor]
MVLISASLLVSFLGCIGILTLHPLFQTLLSHRLPLKPGSESYNGWKKVPFPIYQRFYYFNVTNPDEFLNFGEKPVLEEVGPYTWRSEWVKEAVEWHANGTLQYRERKRFWFDREQSAGDQEDVIFTINTPLVAASQKIRNASPLIKLAFLIFLNAANETLFIRRSIRQLTYEGYPDVLAHISHVIDPNVPVKDGRFAYMSGKNDTDEGLFNVYTGSVDLRYFNRIDKWNGRTELPWWESGTPCAKLLGTNGELVHPIVSSDEHIYFFNPVFCKPWRLTRAPDVDSLGITLTRFVAGPEVLFNSSREPANRCFETPGKSLPSGGMDLSRCQFGLPLVLSYPHFYAADSKYLEKVEGLSPNQERHQFQIDIEPRLGITLGLSARAQINVKLERVDFLKYFRSVPELVFPVFWQDVVIEQTPAFADHIRVLLDRPLFYAQFAFRFMTMCGSLVALGAYIYVVILAKKESKTDSVLFWTTKKSMKMNTEKVTSQKTPLRDKVKDIDKVSRERSLKDSNNQTKAIAPISPSAPPLNNQKILESALAGGPPRSASASSTDVDQQYAKDNARTWHVNMFSANHENKRTCNIIIPR